MDNVSNVQYVYALFDMQKSGHFCYDGLPVCFLFQPFYIGKGKGNRLREHFYRGSLEMEKRLDSAGRDNVTAVKIVTNLNQQEALEIERQYIAAIGRISDGGPLVNLTSGGMIYSHSPITRQRISLNNARYWKGKPKDQKVIQKMVRTKKWLYETGHILHPMTNKKANENQLRGLNRTGTRLTEEHKIKLRGRKPANAVMWKLVSPNGEICVVKGLLSFCSKRNLSQSHLFSVANGERKHHKGWICQKVQN